MKDDASSLGNHQIPLPFFLKIILKHKQNSLTYTSGKYLRSFKCLLLPLSSFFQTTVETVMCTVNVSHEDNQTQQLWQEKHNYQCFWSYFANASAKLLSIVGSKNFKVDIGIASIFCKFQFSSQPTNTTLKQRKDTDIRFQKKSRIVIIIKHKSSSETTSIYKINISSMQLLIGYFLVSTENKLKSN